MKPTGGMSTGPWREDEETWRVRVDAYGDGARTFAIVRRGGEGGDSYPVALVEVEYTVDDTRDAVTEANLRGIVAVPELVAALRDLHGLLMVTLTLEAREKAPDWFERVQRASRVLDRVDGGR